MGAAAFWISLAAFLIAAMYFRSRSETTKHQTLRQIVEKTGQVDEHQLKALFEPPTQCLSRFRNRQWMPSWAGLRNGLPECDGAVSMVNASFGLQAWLPSSCAPTG